MDSKIGTPNVRAAILRHRLHACLDAASSRRAIWICAPAGSGKSTLVASYLSERRLPALWYTVDARDRDPATLFFCLGQAVQEIFGGNPLPTLATTELAHTLAFSRRYFGELFARANGRLMLVFDDCQALDPNDRWFSIVREACFGTLSGTGCVIFVSRQGPAPVFSRLQARSDLALLSWEQLRFDPSEAEELIRSRLESRGLALEGTDVLGLARVCGGWAAGIVLALESSNHRHALQSPEALEGSQDLFDYFMTEVFTELEPRVQRLLLQSALLPCITPELLKALLQDDDGVRALLGTLRSSLFISEYGSSPVTYRYHPLFRHFLLNRLRAESNAATLNRLYRLSARVAADAGYIDDASELMFAANDSAGAAALLKSVAPMLLAQGRLQTIKEWSERLGSDLVANDAWLSLFAGLSRMGESFESATRLLECAFQNFLSNSNSAGLWASWGALVMITALEGTDGQRLGALIDQGIQARSEVGFDSANSETSFALNRALGLAIIAPEQPETRLAVEVALSHPMGNRPEELVLATFFYGFRGEMAALERTIDVWQRRQAKGALAPIAQLTLVVSRAVCSLFSGRLTECKELIAEGQRIAEHSGISTLNTSLLVYASIVHVVLGEIQELELVTDELGELARQGRTLEKLNYQYAAGLEALLGQNYMRARTLLGTAREVVASNRVPVAQCVHDLAYAEALVVCGALDEARAFLGPVRAKCEELGAALTLSARMLEAEILYASDDVEAGDAVLASALALGEWHQCLPMPNPTRVILERLLPRATRLGRHAAYLQLLCESRRLVRHRSGSERLLSPPPTSHVPEDFAKSVRLAFRHLHEVRHLSENSLLESVLVNRQVGGDAALAARIDALRGLLCEAVEALKGNARTETASRCLHHTYVEPAPTQLLAADSAGMPFGSYRRHLTAGLQEVAMNLWMKQAAPA